MLRNLERRVELLSSIDDPKLRNSIKTDILDAYVRDNFKARRLNPDGSYSRVGRVEGEPEFDAQSFFCKSHAARE